MGILPPNLMKRYAEAAIEIINDLHMERLDYDTEYLPLIDAAIQLKNLEEIIGDCDFHRLRELLAADRKNQCAVLPENIEGGLAWITRTTREILFKAKWVDTREWVEGYLWSERTIGYTSPCGNTDEIVIDPETVCQHIGLTDKNEVKAFENDRIFDPHENKVFTIKWDKELAAFLLMDEEGWMNRDIARLSYCEIIGNIHD